MVVRLKRVGMFFPASLLVSAAALAQQAPTPGAVQDTVRDRPLEPTVVPPLIQPPAPGQQADPNAPKFAVSAIQITGNSVISTDQLQAAIKPMLAPQMNLADLNRVAEAITTLYRDRGYRLARAVVVAQRVENGVVRIEVLEGKLGKINIHGNTRYDSAFIESRLGGLSGNAVTLSALERNLLLLNDLPGFTGASVLQPGAEYGTTDLDLGVAEKTVGGNIGFNNYGPTALGRNRVDAAFDLNNPLKLGDQLSARVIESEAGHLNYRRVAYSLAAGPYGTRVGLSTAYTNYSVGGAFARLHLTGTSRNEELFATHPIIRSRMTNLVLGFNLRDTYSNQDVFGAPLTQNHLTDGVVSLLGSRIGDNGAVTTATFQHTSNGRSNNTGLQQNAVRSKFDLDVSHLQPIARDLDLYLRGQVVYSDQALPDVDRFGIGGPDSVRAFSTSESRGDRGHQGTVEGRYRFSIFGTLAVATAFVDSGQVYRLGPAATVPKESLTGAGVGLNLFPVKALRVRAEFAHRLDRHKDSDNATSGRFWLTVVYTY